MAHLIDKDLAQKAIERVVRTGYVSGADEEVLTAVLRLIDELAPDMPAAERRLALADRLERAIGHEFISTGGGKTRIRLMAIEREPGRDAWAKYDFLGKDGEREGGGTCPGKDFFGLYKPVPVVAAP